MKALQRIVCIPILLWHECQCFQRILLTIVSHYQYLLHREQQHINLLVGHVDYRWAASWRILLQRSRSICQRTPFCRIERQTSHDLRRPLLNSPQTMPRHQWHHSVCSFRVDMLWILWAASLHYPSPTWQQEASQSSHTYILSIRHNWSLLITNKAGERSLYYPQHSDSIDGRNLSCCLYMLMVVFLCATN